METMMAARKLADVATELNLRNPLQIGHKALKCVDGNFTKTSITVFTIGFLHNSTFPAKSWQDPARIDILWVATIGCQ